MRKSDLFADLDNYKSEMSISQAVKYFERHGVGTFTKTMIQNYIRVGVLPQPEDKRRYAKKQLCALAIIDSLKDSFALDEIRALFTLPEAEHADGNYWYGLYLEMLEAYNSTLDDGSGTAMEDALALMAKSAAYRNLALKRLEGKG